MQDFLFFNQVTASVRFQSRPTATVGSTLPSDLLARYIQSEEAPRL
jgi:hypothetical protein